MAEPMPELNLGLTGEQISQLGRVFRADRKLFRTDSPDLVGDDLVKAVAEMDVPLVYTAFDGDHFELTPQMRAWVLRRGWVPANPENIVGYKDSVDAHTGSKAGVLLDDLAIVGKCDILCVFTDVPATPAEATAQLAEGVIVELLYFLNRWTAADRPRRVLFVRTDNLFGKDVPPVEYEASFVETFASLAPDQRGVKSLLNSVWQGTRKLPEVAYIAHDPLDAKYVHWLRAFGYQNNVVPLVTTLALSLADTELLGDRRRAMGRLLAARYRLLWLADRVWMLGPQDVRDRVSNSNQLLDRVCTVLGRKVETHTWFDVGIPKAVHESWALTEREAALAVPVLAGTDVAEAAVASVGAMAGA